MRLDAGGYRSQLELQNLGGKKPTLSGTVKVSIKAHDLKPVCHSSALLVCVIEVEFELRRHIDEGLHFARCQKNQSDADSVNHILQELAKNLELILPK